MQFKQIPKIEEYEFYINLAFRRAKKASESLRKKRFENKIEKVKELELSRLNAVRDIIVDRLKKILQTFPNFEKLSPFYKELCDVRFDVKKTKKSLAKVKNTVEFIEKLYKEHVKKLKNVKNSEDARKIRKAFYGRVVSVMKELNDSLKVLAEAAKKMKQFPDVKDNMFTVAITGFPNVGKSTLLKKLTNTNPEIAPYAFTTKTLNVGFIDLKPYVVQIIDTPGTLAREKLNKIEEEAFIAMKNSAHLIIYIFDLTQKEILEKQKLLLEKTKELRKPIIKYLSKTDILDEKEVKKFLEECQDCVTDLETLKKEIKKYLIEYYKGK